MPTTLPRHAITETPEVRRALDRAAVRWPNAPRSQLPKLVIVAFGADDGDGSEDARRRTAARRKLIGSRPGSSGVYNRADDWPLR